MKLESEMLKVVATERKKGESPNGSYDFTMLYANTKEGIQNQIAIPNELENKCIKDKEIKIIYEMGYKGKVYAKEIK